MTPAVQNQIVLAVRSDIAWLERRHTKWEKEVEAKHRTSWWLKYSEHDLALARLRLERYLEVDLRDPAEATAQQ